MEVIRVNVLNSTSVFAHDTTFMPVTFRLPFLRFSFSLHSTKVYNTLQGVCSGFSDPRSLRVM